MNSKVAQLLLAATLAVGNSATAKSNVNDLISTLTPVTTGAKPGSRWVTIQAQLEVPTNIEAHLLNHYITMWGQNEVPESFEKLKDDFNQATPEDKGFPVVSSKGEINTPVALYWIQRHLNTAYSLRRGGSDKVSITINQTKSSFDQEKQILRLVYNVRLEVPAGSGNVDLTVPMALNLHDQYMKVLGAGGLRKQALEQLAQGELPRPRLEWRHLVTAVKNSCLEGNIEDGVLTMERFLDKFNPSQTKCAQENFSRPIVLKDQAPVKDGKFYPEYAELFRDNNLSILIAIQECNEARYSCSEDGFGQRTQIEQLMRDLKDFGYTQTSQTPNLKQFSRQVGALTLNLKIFHQKRPVHYENTFWQLYRDAEIVLTNRLPMVKENYNKVYVPRYQIVVANNVTELGWGRILPELDYQLRNLDAVDLSFSQITRNQLLSFVEQIAQTSTYYQQPKWSKDTDWQTLLAVLEKDSSGNAVAHYVRGNGFVPGRAATPIGFGNSPALNEYINLINAKLSQDESDEISSSIDYRLAYLYLTLHYGDRAHDFASLQSQLQELCKTQITNAQVKDWYFFARNCSPRSLLTSEKTNILGAHFARGSFLELYFGSAGIPKVAYLSGPTQIGEFKFKGYFEDTAGGLLFHKSNGKVMQGHLAEPMEYKGLPLLGGMGTSMVRFYEDGTLRTAQLRQDAKYTHKGQVLTFKGATRGPQQVSFHPTGELECAYLSGAQKIGVYELAGVNDAIQDIEGTKEARKVCFHANGQLRSGMLAREMNIGNTPYPAGVVLNINNQGKLLGPTYQVMGDNEFFWQTKFPAQSLYMVAEGSSNPKWMRLNGDVTLRGHSLTKGTEVVFTERGSFSAVKAPKNGTLPRIVFRDYSITVPAGATLRFSGGEASELMFTGTIKLGDAQFIPEIVDGKVQPLQLHSNARVSEGIIAQDLTIRDVHYGSIALKGGTKLSLTEEGNLSSGTLAANTNFTYMIQNADEIPDGMPKDTKSLRPVQIAAGSRVELDSQSKLQSVELAEVWRDGELRVEAGGELTFNDAHQVGGITFSKNGGQVGQFVVGQGNVRLYPSGFPKAIVLAKNATLGKISVPAGANIEFFASTKIKQIAAPEGSNMSFTIEGLNMTREISFYENGKMKRGYLLETIVYGGVKVASLNRCLELRFARSGGEGNTCAVTFYEDGKSFESGVLAENATVQGRELTAGQPVEFDETGKLFLK